MHLFVCCISSLNILATSFAASPQNQDVYFIEKLMSKLDPSWFQKMGLHYFLSFAPDWFRCTASDCRNTKLQTAVMKPHYLTLKKKSELQDPEFIGWERKLSALIRFGIPEVPEQNIVKTLLIPLSTLPMDKWLIRKKTKLKQAKTKLKLKQTKNPNKTKTEPSIICSGTLWESKGQSPFFSINVMDKSLCKVNK